MILISTNTHQTRKVNVMATGQGRASLVLGLVLVLVILTSPVSQATSRTLPIALEPGDSFTYRVLDDHMFVAINGTTFLNQTYLKEPTSEVKVSVLGMKNVTDDDANWGINTIVNQSEITDSGATRETFSYVDGWLDHYHFGILSIFYVFGVMMAAPHVYSFKYNKPLIQVPQVGLPIFTTTNGSYYEELMEANPPTDGNQSSMPPSTPPGAEIPPYNLTYQYDADNGIFVMEHVMSYEGNGTLLQDNTTTWSLELKMDFLLDTTFSKSIVNQLKSVVYWNVRVGNATHVLDWGLHVVLKDSLESSVTENENLTSTTTSMSLLATMFMMVILGTFLAAKKRTTLRRKTL